MEEDDAMDIDETISDAQIIVRESTGVHIIGGPTRLSSDLSKADSTESKSEPKKSMDVVVLDDDEDEPVPSKKSKKKPEDSVEIIDLVEKSVNSKCINYGCTSGKELMVAPNLCLSYYRVKNAGNGKKEVCTECYDAAIREYDMLATELKAGKILCDIEIPIRHDTVEIDDSDEEDLEGRVLAIDDENLKFIEDNFERILSETMAKLKFDAQTEKEVDFLKDKKNKVNDSINELQGRIKDMRNSLDSIQFNLYKEFRTGTVETSVISIIDDHFTSLVPTVRTESTSAPAQRKSQRNARRVSYAEVDSPNSNSPKPKDDMEQPTDLPIMGQIEPPAVNIDDLYYISRENTPGSWIKARLKAVLPPGTLYNGHPTTAAMYKVIELKQHKERVVDGKNIASMKHSRIRLETGTRVIAVFKEISPTGEVRKSRHDFYYSGIVAEPPVAQNKYRYLIFFDIGYSQYVAYTNVHVVFEWSKNVWEDMHANSRAFIKKYLESQDRPMVKLSKGQTVRVEYNGKWVLCTIMNVDCSLVLVFFDSLNRMEWIYRGSTRLSPMFKEEQNAAKRHTGGRTSNRKLGPSESAAIVQYTKNSDFEKPTDSAKTVRAVARKSTARPETSVSGAFVPFLPQVNNNVMATEPTSKIMYFTPRDQVITQRLYRPHVCSPACKDYVRHNLSKLRGHNPLSKPLLCGWARITQKFRGRKEIVYKAPCSRILRDMDEIHKYLRMTKSEMTVDLFDFNHMVRCLAEFNVECVPDPKDLSKGLEQVAIPVINGINNEMLDFCNYATKRVPMEDVPLNTDTDFLVGCDCTDDCADKMKCACWKLTLEGSKYMGKNVDPASIGYIYRRLHEQVLTGIYECNSTCKCSSTCLNRVVQNPMSIKLQVFRTHNRGWGIRCVNDVPQGTFICIYAGTIHTEQMANEDGVTYGDEYFAELDYIENCEKHKEDYESDVNEPDSPRSRSRSATPDYDEEKERKMDGRRRRWNKEAEDNDFTPAYPLIRGDFENSMRLRRRKEEDKTEDVKVKKELERSVSTEGITGEIETVTISDDEDDPKEVLSFNPKSGSDLDDNKPRYASVRSFFGEDEPYIMDTKNAGNIGRFLNHSCSPNVFVQNVFVDTHDLRFPWVAFFCSQFIRAGTELTWNYNYDIGSVPGRVLYCHCGSLECKGRLL